MSERERTVVLDAGHGGDAPAGGSSPNNASAPNGLLEKDLTLDLALRVRRLLAGRAKVLLTRDGRMNLSLTERARIANANRADLFVSLHWNGDRDPHTDGTAAWVARQAAARSRALARRIVDRLAIATQAPNRGVRQRDLGVLLPSRHSGNTAGCLVEVAYLTNPSQANRLERDAYREELARAVADSIAETLHVEGAASLGYPSLALDITDASPFLKSALDQCFEKLQDLKRNAARSTNPNSSSAARILKETGIKVDANPYVGITREELRAVIHAAYHSHQMPEALLALWAKEGSTRSVTSPKVEPHAKTAVNARTLFRSEVFYLQLGTDHFIKTTYSETAKDNIYDPSDSAAAAHEAHFKAKVRELVSAGVLSEDISDAINAELTVAKSGANYTVLPSTKFYALALLLADAYFTWLQRKSYPQLGSISVPLNYLQWNMGAAKFAKFLQSADMHRQEKQYATGGSPITIDEWALHRTPKSNEYLGPRRNAIRFLHYLESYEPLFSTWMNLIKPGIEDLQEAGSRTAGALAAERVEYDAARSFTPSADPALFRCVPDPVYVIPATLLPSASTTPDPDSRSALRTAGLSQAQVTKFERNGGLAPLRPIAEFFGEAALAELLARLRYHPAQIANPPHTYGASLSKKLGVRAPALLAARLLFAIPGHFRELARRAPDGKEAFALENLGWLLMASLRSRIEAATKKKWWIPAPPAWVTPFASTLPSLRAQVTSLITSSAQIDTTLSYADFDARFAAWRDGLPGAQWRLETGVTPSTSGPGQPFYPEIVTLPARVNIATEKSRIDRAWQQRLTDTDARITPNTRESRAALIQCENNRLAGLGLTAPGSLGGLEIAVGFPRLQPAPGSSGLRTSLTVLDAIRPTFEQLMSTIHDLGWNDLLFQTEGSFCFRGVKLPLPLAAKPNPQAEQAALRAARRVSDHGYAIAVDFHPFENPQGSRRSTMDPRIVRTFEAFRYKWGKCFPTPDPHHFEYAG